MEKSNKNRRNVEYNYIREAYEKFRRWQDWYISLGKLDDFKLLAEMLKSIANIVDSRERGDYTRIIESFLEWLSQRIRSESEEEKRDENLKNFVEKQLKKGTREDFRVAAIITFYFANGSEEVRAELFQKILKTVLSNSNIILAPKFPEKEDFWEFADSLSYQKKLLTDQVFIFNRSLYKACDLSGKSDWTNYIDFIKRHFMHKGTIIITKLNVEVILTFMQLCGVSLPLDFTMLADDYCNRKKIQKYHHDESYTWLNYARMLLEKKNISKKTESMLDVTELVVEVATELYTALADRTREIVKEGDNYYQKKGDQELKIMQEK